MQEQRTTVTTTLFVATACALLLGGVSCTRRHSPQVTTRLIYWSANNQYEVDLAKALTAEWNTLHPEIPVVHQPVPESQSTEEAILAAVVGKTTPDVFSNMWPGDVEAYARAGQLVPLDTFPDFAATIGARVDSLLLEEARSGDGHLYQIPWKSNPVMVIYNVKMLAEAGFSHFPATYSEYLDAANKVTRDTDGDGHIDRWMGITDIRALWWQRFFDFYPLYIAATGGRTLLEHGKVCFDNREAIEVFAFLRTLFARGYFPKERMVGRTDAFLQGMVASRFTGPWEIRHAEKFKPEGFVYDFAPMPRPDGAQGPVYTYGDMKNIVIFKNTRFPRQAWEFAKFLVSREADLKLLELTDQLPLRKGLLGDPLYAPYFARNPFMVRFASQASLVRGTDTSPVLKEIFDIISNEFEACVVYGVKTPERAIADAAAQARLVLE